MPSPSIEIRSATSEDLSRAVSAIVAAFVTDPPARFAWPAPHGYLQAMPVAVREFGNCCVQHGTPYVTADFCGAALWLPPGVDPSGEAIANLFRETVKRERLDDLLATFKQMEQSHPREPHWYLPQIGVDPTRQGEGLGAALMQHALARCDREKALAYLEASKAENVTFYQRYGFEVITEIQIGAGPRITPMVRRPR